MVENIHDGQDKFVVPFSPALIVAQNCAVTDIAPLHYSVFDGLCQCGGVDKPEICAQAREWVGCVCGIPHQSDPRADVVLGVAADKRRAMTAHQEKLFGIDKLNVPRSEIPAVTHVDYSARIQTVNVETNPRYHALISRFKDRTGCPVIVNTSFNVRDEPIVCTPEDAYKCFMATEMDLLVLGNYVLAKETQ